MGEKKLNQYSEEEYLELEFQSAIKNEFENGFIRSMGGGTLNHGIIGNNINTEINNAIRKKGLECVSINGDVRIYIEKAKSFVYPDGMAVCGEIKTYKHDKHSIINPKLIIEVLSKSTESYDRGDKFHKYCSLDSFCEYLLIDQYKPVVDSLYKGDVNYWKMVTCIGLEKKIFINTLDCFISMEDIYRNTQDLYNPQFTIDFT